MPDEVTEDIHELREEMAEALKELRAGVLSVSRYASPQNNSAGTSTVTIDAGKGPAWIAVWISTICCTAMMVAMVFGGMWMLHQAKQIDDLNAYLQAIYQQAPSLQPPKESQK